MLAVSKRISGHVFLQTFKISDTLKTARLAISYPPEDCSFQHIKVLNACGPAKFYP